MSSAASEPASIPQRPILGASSSAPLPNEICQQGSEESAKYAVRERGEEAWQDGANEPRERMDYVEKAASIPGIYFDEAQKFRASIMRPCTKFIRRLRNEATD